MSKFLFCKDAVWLEDNETDYCMNPRCRMKFGILPGKHKHHCRWCGLIFCSRCAPLQILTNGTPFLKEKIKEARRCNSCRVPLVLRSYAESSASPGKGPSPLQAEPMDIIMSYLDGKSKTCLLQSCAALMYHFHAEGIRYRRTLQERFPTLFEGAQVGKGACGTVYKVEDRQNNNKRVAVKVVTKSTVLSYPMWRKLQSEIEIMRHNHHPNIAELLEVFQTRNCLVLVIEAGEGGSLKHCMDIVRKKHWDVEAFVAHVIHQVSEGLSYLFHERQVAHRDIKQDNIVLSKDFSKVLIIDFGLAEYVLSEDQTYVPCGTMGFASPENIQAVVERQPKFRATPLTMHLSDMFSLGVVAFMLLSGQKPLKGTRFVELHAEVKRGVRCAGPKWDGVVSDAAKNLLNHLLVTATDRRATPRDVAGHVFVMESQAKMATIVAERTKDLEHLDKVEGDEWDFIEHTGTAQFEEDFDTVARRGGPMSPRKATRGPSQQ